MSKHIVFIIAAYLLPLALLAKANPGMGNNKVPCFRENKGQVTDQFGHPRSDIQFKLDAPALSVFVGAGAIHYQWTKQMPEMSKDSTNAEKKRVGRYPSYRLDMELIGANPKAKVITEDRLPDWEKYYQSKDVADGTKAYAYKKITYRNIYPHIDWVLYTKATASGQLTVKYDFIVRPKGKVSDIKLRYGGASSIKLNELGAIVVQTPAGSITEAAPYTYDPATKQAISSKFLLSGNTISFVTEAHKGSLVIDPTLDWCTYYGDIMDDVATSVTCDLVGNVYMAGVTNGTVNIATTGSYLSTNPFPVNTWAFPGAANYAHYLVKFNREGVRQWATYYGGMEDIGNGIGTPYVSITCDKAGYIYMTGLTNNPVGVATPGSHRSIIYGYLHNYDWEVYIVKFDTAGVRQWGTYYGGDDYDRPSAITCDNKNNVYVAGTTASVTGIATGGSYLSSGASGFPAFIVKFNSAGVRQWGTYYADRIAQYQAGTYANILGLTCDKYGFVYACGVTDYQVSMGTPNSFQPAFGGAFVDGFIAKFSTNGVRQWGTYYGGPDWQLCNAVICDDSANLYMAGETSTPSLNYTTPGAHQTNFGGGTFTFGGDALLAKFDSSGKRLWGTYFGGSGPDHGTSLMLDDSGYVYMGGTTESPNNIAYGVGYQDTFGGAYDAFITKFNTQGQQQWGTYFGGTGAEICKGIAYGKRAIYMAGDATWSFTRAGVATVAKDSVVTNISTPGSFKDTLSPAFHYHDPNQPYGYDYATDAFLAKFNLCPPPPPPLAPIAGKDTLCAGSTETYTILAVPGTQTYTWTLPSGWQGSSTTNSITVTTNDSSGIISVQTWNGCDSSQVQIKPVYIAALYPGQIVLDKNIHCANDSFLLSVDTPREDMHYLWSLGNGDTRTRSSFSYAYPKGTYDITLITTNLYCSDTVSITGITVGGKLELTLTADPTEVQRGAPIILNTTGNQAYQIISWKPELLFANQTAYHQTVLGDSNRHYKVVGLTSAGCIDSAEVAVTIKPNIVVPTAFSPDGNGRNDIFRPIFTDVDVRGFTFNIYSRWGALLFTSHDLSQGWDGTVKGVPAEIGVYMYTIEFGATTENKHYNLKGEVTLIR